MQRTQALRYRVHYYSHFIHSQTQFVEQRLNENGMFRGPEEVSLFRINTVYIPYKADRSKRWKPLIWAEENDLNLCYSNRENDKIKCSGKMTVLQYACIHPFSKLGSNNQALGEGLGTKPSEAFLPLRCSLCGGGDMASCSQPCSVAVLEEGRDKVSGSPGRGTSAWQKR